MMMMMGRRSPTRENVTGRKCILRPPSRVISGLRIILFIGPESDHLECLSVTHSLTDSCLVNLIDVILACEDANSKLVDVGTW